MRSLLFVPGNSAGMLLNADVHGADGLILDLEDAVAPGEKDAARRLVQGAVQALGYPGITLIIRLNPLGTPYVEEDIARMVPLKPHLLMPTKVADAKDIAAISILVSQAEEKAGLTPGSVGLIPLLETAQGIENALSIAQSDPRVKALLLGAEDLSSDLQATRSKEGAEIAYARGRIVMAARAAGVDVYDTPFTDVHDDEGLTKDAALARSLGFTGKAAISPRHVAGINAAFTPTESDIRYAREVLAAIQEGQRLGRGAVSLRGKMVDKPIVDRANRVLETAAQLGLEGGQP